MYNKILILYVEEKIDYFKSTPKSETGAHG